ncbi:type II secretion system protein [Burkholderia sp. Bp9143]|uniref:type II secretion system protein n=1 Tax=Burkholderia sp. Bp9143 TaxID=2184574 RepID=UPI000F5B302D|nr:type II secretion system protein [Burkholderia sp. Bp9143]RQR26211.1 type II secretion system protein [Burkholderia sp. Bp9143]
MNRAGRGVARAMPACRRGGRQRGLVLLALLIALMLMSIALAGALDVWSLQRRREQERQLLFVGDQYRRAIVGYYRLARAYPQTVDDLLDDTRFAKPMPHLRRAYPDPVSGKNDWSFLWRADRFYGIYSSSDGATIKRAGFPDRYKDFEGVETYRQWKFIYLAPGLAVPAGDASAAVPTLPASAPSLSGFAGGSLPGRVPAGLR